jgi:hypothetical protein
MFRRLGKTRHSSPGAPRTLLFGSQRFRGGSDPIANQRKAKLIFLQRFRNELVSFKGLNVQEMAVKSKENVGHHESDSLVPVLATRVPAGTQISVRRLPSPCR